MLNVTTNDGMSFTGESFQSIVRQMRNTQWNAPIIKHDYMLEVAERVESMTGRKPDTTDAASFVTDLQAIGLVQISETKEESSER